MRVALFVHHFFPESFYGTETYTLDLARNLGQLGHEPKVVAGLPRWGRPKGEEEIRRYEYQGIPVYAINRSRFPALRAQDAYHQPELKPLFRDLLGELRPDLVHVTHLMNHTCAVLDAASELGLPAVATLTDFYGICPKWILEAADDSLCYGPNPERTNCLACSYKIEIDSLRVPALSRALGGGSMAALYAGLAAGISRVPGIRRWRRGNKIRAVMDRPEVMMRYHNAYQALIAPTRFLKRVYVANGLSAPIHEIRFGIDLPRPEGKPPRPPGGPVRFGYIGQLAPHKGPHLLLKAFQRLPEGAAQLHFFGPLEHSPEYARRLRRSAVGRGIHFRDLFPRERIFEVMSQVDFLVLPSTWHENSPLVLLSALASRTPVVASDVEGMSEFIEPGVNGFLFERGDVAGLERVLRRVLEDPERALSMSRTTEYPRTARQMTEETLALYRQALSGAPASAG